MSHSIKHSARFDYVKNEQTIHLASMQALSLINSKIMFTKDPPPLGPQSCYLAEKSP